jgi:hypothetical protein
MTEKKKPKSVEVNDELASPACFLHELDPSYLGYLTKQETAVLIASVRSGLTANHSPALDAQLQEAARQLGPAVPPAASREEVLKQLRIAVPRVADNALHAALKKLLATLDGTH